MKLEKGLLNLSKPFSAFRRSWEISIEAFNCRASKLVFYGEVKRGLDALGMTVLPL
jgi:hypothetical protein